MMMPNCKKLVKGSGRVTGRRVLIKAFLRAALRGLAPPHHKGTGITSLWNMMYEEQSHPVRCS